MNFKLHLRDRRAVVIEISLNNSLNNESAFVYNSSSKARERSDRRELHSEAIAGFIIPLLV